MLNLEPTNVNRNSGSTILSSTVLTQRLRAEFIFTSKKQLNPFSLPFLSVYHFFRPASRTALPGITQNRYNVLRSETGDEIAISRLTPAIPGEPPILCTLPQMVATLKEPIRSKQ